MELPVAPPAFDATVGTGRRRRADLGADIGAGCGLVLLELIALVVIFGLWFLSGFSLDPAESVPPDPLWNYLAAVGGVGVLAGVAAAIAARARALVTVVSQAVMVGLVCVVVFGGVAVQAHQNQRCRDMPTAVGCEGSDEGS
jgi:intracellular septation protein A